MTVCDVGFIQFCKDCTRILCQWWFMRVLSFEVIHDWYGGDQTCGVFAESIADEGQGKKERRGNDWTKESAMPAMSRAPWRCSFFCPHGLMDVSLSLEGSVWWHEYRTVALFSSPPGIQWTVSLLWSERVGRLVGPVPRESVKERERKW